ncbi:DcaP family trimeric outer membrane transporter, partial [Vibrio genomosp. F10 str. 9ZD137]
MNMTKLPFLAPCLIATSAMTLASPALSANETEYSFGGSINTVFLFDSNVSGAGANIPADALYNKETYGDNKIDATLSQLSAGAKRTLNDGSTISARYVMDFNAKNDSSVSPRIREAYLRWNKGSGQIIAGQTWSTLMDIRKDRKS